MDADRNLLFGVLALQAELIDSGQFIEACLLWTTRKQTSLADLLIERRWIEPADRGHVDYLLERKLRKHAGDIHASLSALPEDVKQSLAALGDGDIQQSLANLGPSAEAGATIAHVAVTEDRYRRLRLHATGGIGRIWLAHDNQLGRDVALKELRPERAVRGTSAARFLQEAQITGQLEHPGIIPVYELVRGDGGGPAFYTMRFVKGRTLSQAARAFHDKRLAGREDAQALPALLNAFATVCNTLAYAHARGVIHRDLKGPNVVLGDFGEVVVLDWGLAKVIGRSAGMPEDASIIAGEPSGDSGHTMQGQALGTPAYMAPEQSAGSLELIDQRTDVYGLGAILYEILTGAPPFSGGSTEEVLRKVREDEPASPRSIWPEAPPALEALCLRALSKRREDRPAAAADLAQEVQGWQEFERRKAEDELRKSRERFELAVQGSQDGLWDWDLITGEIYYSPRYKAMLGYADDELPNRSEEWTKRLHPDDVDRVRAELRAEAEGRESLSWMEFRMRHKDGSYRWIRSRAFILRDTAGRIYRKAGSHEDITDRRSAEEELARERQLLRHSEERYRSVIAAMQDGILILNGDGSIVSCNAAAERILGLSGDQIMGRTPHDPRWRAIHEDGSPFPGETHPPMVTLRTGQPCTDVVMGVHKPDGTLTWITVNAQPLLEADGRTLAGVAASFEDITERKRMEAQLRQDGKPFVPVGTDPSIP